uniref:AAA domain-containing protein n=1 Tax=Candidatus Electrothrix sp. TaxID=2170559 RepID=UPI0040579230
MPDKTTRLLEYLAALTKLSTKTVFHLDEYEQVFWLHSLPSESPLCFCRVWKQEEQGDDIWLTLKKAPQQTAVPLVPDDCSLWLEKNALTDYKQPPKLKQSVTLDCVEGNKQKNDQKPTRTLYLKDFPAIREQWQIYLKKQWQPWAEECNIQEKVRQAYKKLFLLHQELKKSGDQYELILGLGLLCWQNENRKNQKEIKRHVAVAGLSLTFEAEKGLFTVQQDSDKAEIELDMLGEQPLDTGSLIDEGRAAVSVAVYDRTELDAVLRKIAHSLGAAGQGEYCPDRVEPAPQTNREKPLLEYAPALILRKRGQRGLDQLLAELKKQPTDILSSGFRQLCNIIPEEESPSDKPAKLPGELYFPLPANEEQQKIVRTLDMQAGVLVQGPPGTGKSHTITNLISHLLATGKRILVTAKTKQALQVLHDKLPKELRPLAISLLGEDKSTLTRSVEGILAQWNIWDETENNRRIDELEAHLHAARKSKAAAEQQILALREQETFTHQLAGGRCSGTAAQIARQLRSDADNFSWFTDAIPLDAPLPLSAKESNFLYKYFTEACPTDEEELILQLPASETMPPVSKVEAAFQKEAIAKEKAASEIERLQSESGATLLCVGKNDKEAIGSLHQQAQEMTATFRSLQQNPMPWLNKVIDEVLSGQSRVWQELLKLSQESVSGLEKLVAETKRVDVDIPPDINRKALLASAKELHEHFKTGGTTGRWIFKPEAVRKHGSIVAQVKVDGQDCLSLEPLEKLVAWLTVEQQLDQAWSFWQGRAKRDSGPFRLQLIALDEMHKVLEKVLRLRQIQRQVRKAAKACGLNLEQKTEASMQELVEDCRAVLARLRQEQVSSSINKLQYRFADLAKNPKAHPVAGQLAASIAERDSAAYARLLGELNVLAKKVKRMQAKQQVIAKLAETAPNLAVELNNGREWQLWPQRLAKLKKAWTWAQASSWLKGFFETDLTALMRQSQRLDQEIQGYLSKLAAKKAWGYCFERMSDAHRQHLIAWQLAMNKVGKGTGKNTFVHRRNAQQHLRQCRDAVPAWIMPLHQVYETVNANTGLFDVIIVDEASQCGPEALPLFLLGKRLIVVGDDKQVSPEAVGIEQAQVQQLMRTWLTDFDHADSFGPDTSLFDHCRIRFKNCISLREHFRCMPEIIRFSSALCYTDNPLIPLRQYTPDRLDPLQSVFVETGYREGTGQKIINKPEAEAIAETIKKCSENPKYSDKSIGVIVLQGSASKKGETAQSRLIQSQLLETIGPEKMEKYSIICGNPPSFQGDERDIIFLSMVAAPNANFTSLTAQKYEQRFNVAVSRAKDQLWLFHSVTVNHLRDNCLRRKLLEHFQNPDAGISIIQGINLEELRLAEHQADRKTESAPRPFDSWFEVDVALQIAARGYKVVPQYPFAGRRIDLVIQGTKGQLAVECDGDYWHGPERYAADLVRQRQLERCGWQFFRIRECLYYADADKALASLWPLLERMEIAPAIVEKTAVL